MMSNILVAFYQALYGLAREILILIVYASSEGSSSPEPFMVTTKDSCADFNTKLIIANTAKQFLAHQIEISIFLPMWDHSISQTSTSLWER